MIPKDIPFPVVSSEVDWDTPPSSTRYMTYAEAKAMECNGCGDCCTSLHHDPPNSWSFGAIPEDQWSDLNGGNPLIIPLTFKGNPRPWRESDDNEDGVTPPYDCDALMEPDRKGRRFCALWDESDPDARPEQCDLFPVDRDTPQTLLEKGRIVVLMTAPVPRCTWVSSVLVPDDWPLLAWRNKNYTLNHLPDRAWDALTLAYRYTMREVYNGELVSNKEWLRVVRMFDEAKGSHA